ncbi:extracellular solute-binding protein [Paenibacillus mesophilus]|uniref:ABC transporter substrate-binding protein n=1 Tax=Paenibacillus mesophilus TaxID=2582849 RepID=UPI00110D4D52|nr:extracellular solute-binding protein [Paenibacillus mesophilus]TMV48573.1 extracellular solute-binding protein [Paenibacillus mesophilus]
MSKKMVSMIAMLSVMSAFAMGCAKGSGGDSGADAAKDDPNKFNPNEPAELVVFTSSGADEASFNDRFGNYLKKKLPNYTFKFIQSKKGTTLPELMAAGEKFDIFYHTIGNFEYDLSQYNLQYDMTELIKKNKIDLTKFEPTVIDAIKQVSDGKMYALPVNIFNIVLYYNKLIFDKFGVPYPKDGMTWDETLATAKKLTRTENGLQYYGFATSPQHILRMNQFSLPTIDIKTGAPTINQNEKWKQFFQTVFVDPAEDEGYRALKKIPALSNFTQEQNVAMYAYLSAHIFNNIKGVNWDHVDMVSLPTFKELPGIGSQAYPLYFGVTKLSKNPEAAFHALMQLTSAEFQTESAKQGNMPVLVDESIRKQIGKEAEYPNKNYNALYFNKFAPIPPRLPYDANLVVTYAAQANALAAGTTDMNTSFRKTEETALKAIEDLKRAK